MTTTAENPVLVKFRKRTSRDVFGTSYLDSVIYTYKENPVYPNQWVLIGIDKHGADWELMIEGEDDNEDYNPCKAQTWSEWKYEKGDTLSDLRKQYEGYTEESVFVQDDGTWMSVVDGVEIGYHDVPSYLFYKNSK